MVETNPLNPAADPQTPQPGIPQSEPTLNLPRESVFDFTSFVITVFVISLLATGAVFGYRYFILQRVLDDQKQEIATLENELKDPKLVELDKQIQEIATGIDKIRPILEEKIRYAELFWTLRKVTEKNVRWTSLGFNEGNQLSLTGEGAGWGNVARQLAGLKKDDKFSDVELASANLSTTESGARVQFSVTAQVNTEKLVPPAQ